MFMSFGGVCLTFGQSLARCFLLLSAFMLKQANSHSVASYLATVLANVSVFLDFLDRAWLTVPTFIQPSSYAKVSNFGFIAVASELDPGLLCPPLC